MCSGEAGVGGPNTCVSMENLIILGAWERRRRIFELNFLKSENFRISTFLNFLKSQVIIFIIFDVLEVLGRPETDLEWILRNFIFFQIFQFFKLF